MIIESRLAGTLTHANPRDIWIMTLNRSLDGITNTSRWTPCRIGFVMPCSAVWRAVPAACDHDGIDALRDDVVQLASSYGADTLYTHPIGKAPIFAGEFAGQTILLASFILTRFSMPALPEAA